MLHRMRPSTPASSFCRKQKRTSIFASVMLLGFNLCTALPQIEEERQKMPMLIKAFNIERKALPITEATLTSRDDESTFLSSTTTLATTLQTPQRSSSAWFMSGFNIVNKSAHNHNTSTNNQQRSTTKSKGNNSNRKLKLETAAEEVLHDGDTGIEPPSLALTDRKAQGVRQLFNEGRVIKLPALQDQLEIAEKDELYNDVLSQHQTSAQKSDVAATALTTTTTETLALTTETTSTLTATTVHHPPLPDVANRLDKGAEIVQVQGDVATHDIYTHLHQKFDQTYAAMENPPAGQADAPRRPKLVEVPTPIQPLPFQQFSEMKPMTELDLKTDHELQKSTTPRPQLPAEQLLRSHPPLLSIVTLPAMVSGEILPPPTSTSVSTQSPSTSLRPRLMQPAEATQYEQIGCGWDIITQLGWCQQCADFGNVFLRDCRCTSVTALYSSNAALWLTNRRQNAAPTLRENFAPLPGAILPIPLNLDALYPKIQKDVSSNAAQQQQLSQPTQIFFTQQRDNPLLLPQIGFLQPSPPPSQSQPQIVQPRRRSNPRQLFRQTPIYEQPMDEGIRFSPVNKYKSIQYENGIWPLTAPFF